MNDFLSAYFQRAPGAFNPAAGIPGNTLGGAPAAAMPAPGVIAVPSTGQAEAEDLARRRKLASMVGTLRQRSKYLGTMADSPYEPTSGGGSSQITVSGRQMSHDHPVNLNVGAPLVRGIAAFKQGQADDQAATAESEYTALTDQMSNKALETDPEAQKLYKMVQLGIPGAEDALKKKLVPDQQKLGSLMQAIPNLTPEAAAAIAPQFGVDPEVARQMVVGNQQRTEQTARQAQENALAVAAARRSPPKESEMDFWRRDPEGYAKYVATKGGPKGNDFNPVQELYAALQAGDAEKVSALTKAMSAGKGKEPLSGKEGELQFSDLAPSIQKSLLTRQDQLRAKREQFAELADPATIDAMDKIFANPSNFNKKQAILRELSWMPNQYGANGTAFLGELGRSLSTGGLTPESALVDAYFNNVAVKRMVELGGNDSNEELNKMRQMYPSVANSPEAAKILWKKFRRWLAISEEAARMAEMQAIDPNAFYKVPEKTFYRQAEEKLGLPPVLSPEESESKRPSDVPQALWDVMSDTERQSVVGGN